ncbi:MAG TPA: hypothetical protein VGL79_02295 [Solirubrobacteraceae bacterium]
MWQKQAIVSPRVAERRWSHPSAAIERPRLGVLPRFAHAAAFHARQCGHDRHAELAKRRRRIEAEVERRDHAARLRDLFDQAQRVGYTQAAQAIQFGDDHAVCLSCSDACHERIQARTVELAARLVEVFMDGRHLDPARQGPRRALLTLEVRGYEALSRAARDAADPHVLIHAARLLGCRGHAEQG